MSDAVMITDWYVVPEQDPSDGPIPFARAGRAERADGLATATAGPTWAWADGASSMAHWHGLRPLSASGAGYLFEVPRTRSLTIQPRAPRPLAPVRRPAPVVLPMAPAVLRAMSLAAAATGRAAGELWAEAAREWLARHREDDPEPPTPGASAHTHQAGRDSRPRCWAAIDVLMGDLRAPLPTTGNEPAA